MSLINQDHSLIIACDCSFKRFEEIVAATHDLQVVGAYKIGAALALELGLKSVAELVRGVYRCEMPLIYDHQKAATDIPDTADLICNTVANAGLDAIILFPLSGPSTQARWIQAAFGAFGNNGAIVGGYMTHAAFLESESGYISNDGPPRIFQHAAASGVRDFVIPGNKPEAYALINGWLDDELGTAEPRTFYAPGFVTQGGQISEIAKKIKHPWHAIVGRAIIDAKDIRAKVLELGSQL